MMKHITHWLTRNPFQGKNIGSAMFPLEQKSISKKINSKIYSTFTLEKNSKTLEIPPILSTREVPNHTPSSIKMGATNSQRTSASFKSGMSNCSMTWLGTRPFHTCFTCSDVARWIGQPCLGAGAVVWGWTARKIPHRVYQFIRVHQSSLQQNQAKLRVSRVQPPQPPCSSC